MLEPQSSALLVVFVVTFGALMRWMLITGRAALRVLAAFLAFTLAMIFGVLAVNKYYGYYETWGAAIGDLTGRGVTSADLVPGGGLPSPSQLDMPDSSGMYRRLARQQGYTLRLAVVGQRSHITREVYVY